MMQADTSSQGPPRKLILATDLSGRCDRALDRAVDLTRRWSSGLTAVHALEQLPEFTNARRRFWRTSEDRSAAVARQLRDDIRDDGVEAQVVVEEGDPAELVLRVAAGLQADLVLAGPARSEPFGRLLLGATVERLVRRADAPVLVVRKRVRGAYGNIVVASDFSASSARALETAAALFPGARLTVFHAFQTPFAGMGSADDAGRAWASMARTEGEAFLAGVSLSEETRRELRLLVEPGRPDGVLREYVEHQDVELVVLGRGGRSVVMELLLGSTSDALLHLLPCDVLVVRG
jgi:nucleotide-binding universal stress UspA family protein